MLKPLSGFSATSISHKARFFSFFLVLAMVVGCGEKKPQHTKITAPPAIDSRSENNASTKQPSSETNNTQYNFPKNAKPIYVETGIASWYGSQYHNRKAANGEIFDMNQPTAAHKTLPLNSIVRVTNLKTGKSTILRINDRGPFIGDRILDLSMAAAKEIDVYRAGTAQVKVEVLQSPSPLNEGGRWAVQIGAFTDYDEATKLKNKLARKYQASKVIQFTGPTGEWVRIRPPQDDRKRAFELARDTKSSEGGVFLVRLD
ncbi:MAG: rare lipoprotein [Acidobacteriales bacterium]|nr:rare lipoprotein [Terriglobales bacterium]